MSEVWIKFIEQAPWAAAIIFTVYMFLRHLKELDEARAKNAANMAAERRDHELQINNMWAVNIKTLVEKQNEFFNLIASALAQHDKESKERYDKIGMTKDLIAAVNADKQKSGRS